MNKELRIPDYLEHIAEAIARIRDYANGMDWEDFSANRMAQDAIVRNLEIMGEASRNILRADPEFLAKHPNFPLGNAIGMRNTLAHGYMDVKLDIVWTTVQESLPHFAPMVLQMIAFLRESSAGKGNP